jgi:hypothetical protein
MTKSLAHKLSKTFTAIGACTLASLGLTMNSSAATLLEDNFDSYADQAAFQAAWPAGGGTITSGTLSATLSLSASNSINFAATPATQRNDRSFTESGNPSALNVIRFSIDFFDTSAAASPYRQIASLIDGAPTASGQLISLGMNNNQTSANSGGNYYMARILGYTVPTTADPDGGPAESVGGAGAFFKLNDYGVGLRSTGWHNLAVEITDAEFKFFVDGLLAETVANTATLRSYDSVRLGSGITSTTAANLDNVSVVTNPVPEPGTAALGFLGGLLLLRRRRRS